MSAGDETAPQYLAPVDPQMRIEAADMVRGFALFGVLLVNMFNFGACSIVWTEPEDELAFSTMRFFFETNSWRLYALLFGFGFALQLIRADKRGSNFAPVYLRRLLILFIIGAGHAMIYDGDILMLYAELGLLLVLFRNISQGCCWSWRYVFWLSFLSDTLSHRTVNRSRRRQLLIMLLGSKKRQLKWRKIVLHTFTWLVLCVK